jgi:hypothetical protein
MLTAILLLFCVKHFVVDSLLQYPYMYLNKGNWKHPGGYCHAGLHGLATAAIFAVPGLWWLGIIDAVVHYVIDWTKVNLTKKYGWSQMVAKPGETPHLEVYSNNYFHALILDQCLHFATYVYLASYL